MMRPTATPRFAASDNDVSDEGVREFQRAMPKCEVDRVSFFLR
jgi:hypothetical protein